MKTEEARFELIFDKIMKWYQDEDKYPLTPELQAELLRWKKAREFVLTQRPLTDSFTVNFLMKDCEVSEPQAWRDVRNMKRFFASMEKTNKEWDRIMLVAQIRDNRVKASLAEDYKVVAQCDAILQKMGVGDEVEQKEDNQGKNIELLIDFDPRLIGAKPIPKLFETVAKFIGEEAARRELLIQDEEPL
ncbi:hypothetical protein [Spirosoma oryzicola]|uniref:hypothetical protein n=1 Tax=Spirosoma oryzicola TaxID=2898794 RepID=UPI001E28C431|nr:hypothetical protein [Spirosoma oryzicola]UHG93443.1 hypothetical protein LQ777_11175 [Spirosoma oryzicola]